MFCKVGDGEKEGEEEVNDGPCLPRMRCCAGPTVPLDVLTWWRVLGRWETARRLSKEGALEMSRTMENLPIWKSISIM